MNEQEVAKKIITKSGRPGREIKIDGTRFGNPNVVFKLGTAEDKNRPHTVYINATFWVDIKDKEDVEGFDRIISRRYSKEYLIAKLKI